MRLFSGVTEGLENQGYRYLQMAIDTVHKKVLLRFLYSVLKTFLTCLSWK